MHSDWNDIDDSDSSLSSLSDQENAPAIEKQPPVPPSAASKLKDACTCLLTQATR